MIAACATRRLSWVWAVSLAAGLAAGCATPARAPQLTNEAVRPDVPAPAPAAQSNMLGAEPALLSPADGVLDTAHLLASVVPSLSDSLGPDDSAVCQAEFAELAESSAGTELAAWSEPAGQDGPQQALGIAVAKLEGHEPAQAARVLRAAIRRSPDSAALQRTLGLACYRLGDYPAARTALETSIALDKTSALSYFLLGSTLRKLGEREAAERSFRQAASLDPRIAERQ